MSDESHRACIELDAAMFQHEAEEVPISPGAYSQVRDMYFTAHAAKVYYDSLCDSVRQDMTSGMTSRMQRLTTALDGMQPLIKATLCGS